jgi:hypothetical protein
MTVLLKGCLLAAAGLLLAAPASARTIVITDEDCDKMANISAEAPRLSWGGYPSSNGVFTTFVVTLTKGRSLLLCYPLDRIPKGQRITSAELVLPVNYIAGEPHLQVRRLLADWGTGVCHKYRRAYPKKVPWTKPGAGSVSSDVALKRSGAQKITAIGKQTISVTEDVELWYTGGASNRGWIVNLEENGSFVQMPSPLSPWVPGKGAFKLRITYEPE